MNRFFTRILLIAFASLCFATIAFAYPSLAPEDQAVFEVKYTVNNNKKTESYVVMRDGEDRAIFYIVPQGPRL